MPDKKVRIISSWCDDYSKVEAVVFDMLEKLGGPQLFNEKRVLVKVNLMLGADPEYGTNTHPSVVKAVIKYIRHQGGRADVAESSGALGLTQACFEKSKMDEAVKNAQGGWVNIDAAQMKVYEIGGRRINRIVLPKCLEEYDLIISVAKLKTHPLTGMTGAVKNLMGLAPGAIKPWIHHHRARTPKNLAEALLDIYAAFTPAISITDAIICREAGGSTSGRVKRGNFICGSLDGLALDAWCTDVMGLHRESSPICTVAQSRDLGKISSDDWIVSGDGPKNPGEIPFVPSKLDKKANPIVGFAAYFLRDHAVRPVFPKEGCGDCDSCIDLCPVDSLFEKGGRIHLKRSTCVGCYACVFSCEKELAKLKVAWYAKKVFWKKASDLRSPVFIDVPENSFDK